MELLFYLLNTSLFVFVLLAIAVGGRGENSPPFIPFFCLTNIHAGTELNIDGIFSENVALAKEVGAEGCDGYLLKESKPKLGILCIEKERNLWLLGLSFLAIGAFVGATLSCFISSSMMKRGYCSGRRNTNHSRVPSGQLPEIDTGMEEDYEDEVI